METTATNPAEGSARLSENAAADALAALRKPPQKTEEKAKPEVEREADTDEAVETAETGDGDTTEAQAESGETETTETEQSSGDESEAEAVIYINLPNGDKITAEEARAGYLRQSDYTRKTQAIAQKQREVEAERSELLPRLQKLIADLEQTSEKAPDWLKLSQELDPWEFQKRKTEHDIKSAQKQAALVQLQEAQRAQLVQAQMKARDELMGDTSFDKGWSTADGLKKGMEQIAAWATDFGFDPQLLQSITDAKTVKVLEMARRWDMANKSAKIAEKVVKAKPKPVIKPGGKATASPQDREFQQAKNRLAQTKHIRDATNLLGQLRKRAS